MATWIKAGFWEKLCKPCKGYKGWLNLDELIKSFIPPPPEPTYRVYTALLNSNDISNPIVLENTLGSDIAWNITGGGSQYNGAVDNECFTENKTIGFSYSGGDDESSYYGFIVSWTGTAEIRIVDTSAYPTHNKIRLEIRVYN